MDKETDDRFITLETKFAYLEDFVQKLQEETVKQAKLVEILRTENRLLSERLHDISDSLEEIPNRKPPHY